jgi:hypothetical protein
MVKFKAIYNESNSKSEVVGVYNDIEKAIQALLKRGEMSYCLDGQDEREESLRMRGFCMCGCGPASMEIEEVEC